MKRVVVTGIGIISSIGNDQETIIKNLKELNSGITKAPEYEEFSFRSLVHGKPKINLEDNIDRRLLRFMGDGALLWFQGQCLVQTLLHWQLHLRSKE